MEKILSVAGGYGFCVFSLEILQEFLKKEKIRTKKLLEYFQNNHEKYLASLAGGVWLPFTPINALKYAIQIEGQDSSFNHDWEQKFRYDNFNISVKDSLWILELGHFLKFDESNFKDKELISYQTMERTTFYNGYNGYRFNVPSGKYMLSVSGFSCKDKLPYPNPNHGFSVLLKDVTEFNGYNDPRKDDIYNFNLAANDN